MTGRNHIYWIGVRVAPFAFALVVFSICMLFSGCGVTQGSAAAPAGKGGSAPVTLTPTNGGETSGAAYEQPKKVRFAKTGESSGGEPAINCENVSQGYVVAQAESPARLKFQVSCNGETYNYDMPNDGAQAVFPLNMGDGSYKFRIMQNTSGSNYVELFAQSADVSLESEFSPFLVSNQFCVYDDASACVKKAFELTGSAQNQADVVKAVCEFVAGTISYDNAKAAELAKSTGYVPNPDQTLKEKTGICFDFASLSAAMLRSMGIPTKIVTGYVGADQIYHAWIMVYIDGTWQTALFSVSPNTWSRCDVTFAAAGSNKYIGDASSYTDRYTY